MASEFPRRTGGAPQPAKHRGTEPGTEPGRVQPLGDALSEAVTAWTGLPLSARAERAARNLVIDSLGVALAGSKQAGIVEAASVLSRYGGTPGQTAGGNAPILFRQLSLPLWEAAYLNAAMIHALDFDDVFPRANIHIMSCVLPAALAAASPRSTPGYELIRAIVLGVETAGRLAKWYLQRASNWMWLTTSVIGGFGAVSAAAHVLGLSTEERSNAFGLFYSTASGNRQALVEHTLAKRLQPANAARSAVWASLLAAEGVDGAHRWIEGDGGLLALYAVSSDTGGFDAVASPSVDQWEIENDIIKRYATCGAHHPAMHAAVDLARELGASRGATLSAIQSIEVFIGSAAEQLVGGEFSVSEHPQTDAQFSAAYGVAAALLHGAFDLSRIRDDVVRGDTECHALARKVGFLKSWEYDESDYPTGTKFPPNLYKPQLVRLRMSDGRVIERGCSRIPVFAPFLACEIDPEELARKMRECAVFAGLPPEAGARLQSAAKEVLGSEGVASTMRRRLTSGWLGNSRPTDE